MKTYKVGFTYEDSGFAIIPEAEDVETARAMAMALFKELKDPKITSIQEFDSPQDAVDSFENHNVESKQYVN